MSNKSTSRITTSLFLLMLVSPFSHTEEVLYCVDELATGINFDKGKWTDMPFVKKKRTVKFNDDRSSLKGLDDRTFTCSPVYPNAAPELLICRTSYNTEILFINVKTMRYEYANMSPFGYQTGDSPEVKDTSAIYAGTCTTF